jgi:hypothetical protein
MQNFYLIPNLMMDFFFFEWIQEIHLIFQLISPIAYCFHVKLDCSNTGAEGIPGGLSLVVSFCA